MVIKDAKENKAIINLSTQNKKVIDFFITSKKLDLFLFVYYEQSKVELYEFNIYDSGLNLILE